MESQGLQKLKEQRFKELRRKPVNLPKGELVKSSPLNPDQNLPLVIEPELDDVDLIQWAKANKELIERRLLKHGALLFRNFKMRSLADFRSFIGNVFPQLEMYEIGYAQQKPTRNDLPTALTISSDKTLGWHNDDSFNHFRWPMKLVFYCHKPAQQGGETPLVDCRKLYGFIGPELRERFRRKGVLHVKNYWPELGLVWQNEFGTSDKAAVKSYCDKTGMDLEWLENDRLRTRFVRPLIDKHPATGESIWFSQAQLWHPYNVASEILALWSSAFAEHDYPSNCFYGDGSRIEDADMQVICEAAKKAQVIFKWQQGDILILDNMLVAHARGTFVGAREHFKAQGEYLTLPELH